MSLYVFYRIMDGNTQTTVASSPGTTVEVLRLSGGDTSFNDDIYKEIIDV